MFQAISRLLQACEYTIYHTKLQRCWAIINSRQVYRVYTGHKQNNFLKQNRSHQVPNKKRIRKIAQYALQYETTLSEWPQSPVDATAYFFSFLPVLHASLVRYTLLQRQAIHLKEVFHVLDLGSDSLLPEPLEFGLVRLPRRLVQTLVRVVAAYAAPNTLTVGHGQHLASAAATTALTHAARPRRFGDLQVFGRESGFPAPNGPPRIPTTRKHDYAPSPTTPLSHTFHRRSCTCLILQPVTHTHAHTHTHQAQAGLGNWDQDWAESWVEASP